MSGVCYLAGAGPGDPGLVTLKTQQCIREADVLVYDTFSCAELLTWARPNCEKIDVGKRGSSDKMSQDDINALLVEKVKAGKVVVRLKGGDPMIFGRAGEEAAVLAEAGLKFEIVPGVSSVFAGPVYAGIPLTHREYGSQLTVFSGYESEDKKKCDVDYALLAKLPGTKIFLMGVSRLRQIAENFIEYGADPATPIALTRWATTGRQKTITGTLADIADIAEEQQFKAPAVGVIGNIIKEMDKIDWYENRPLKGKRIVVTRSQEQASDLVKQLSDLGAEVLELPVIRIVDPVDKREFAEGVTQAHTYDWLVFSSVNGVRRFFDAFYAIYKDARSIGGVRIAAVGPGTEKAIREYRFDVDLVPDRHLAEGLLESFQNDWDVDSQTILWVRPENARPVLTEGLTAMQAIVDECIAYKIEPETEDPTGVAARFVEGGADIVIFTSASTAKYFDKLGLAWPDGCKAASIGPLTTAKLKELGQTEIIEAKDHHIDGLVNVIVEALA
jgi:uroporphyrinogen III methyltransferase/synthase